MKRIITLLLVSMILCSAMAWDALYIVGDATPNGWDEKNPTEMNRISEVEFEWTGYLGKGEVKFIAGKDWGCDQYGADEFNKPLTRNTNFTATKLGDDKKFVVTEETKGWYTLHINTAEMRISTYPRYIYPVGDGCEVEWATDGRVSFTETDFGSGKYTGTVTMKSSGEFKFNCQQGWAVQYGPVVGGTSLAACGVYDVNFSDGSEDRKWKSSLSAGTYNMTVDVNNGKLYVVPQEITVKAQVSKEAVDALGSVKCFAWTGIGSETKEMTLEDGFYKATFSTYMPLSFLIYNGKFNNEDGGVQTVDMTNDGNGYYADKCVNVISRRTDNKLMCFHNDGCQLNTNSFTMNIYVEDAGWEDVYFYTQNAGEQSEYQKRFVHATKGADNWYSYTYSGVDAFTWVATATTENWDTQVNDIDNVNADKYIYVTADKHGNGHNKIVTLTGKDQLKDITFEFKFDGASHTSWGDSNPVGLYYWQSYAMDGEDAADHANTVWLNKDENDVYTAIVKAFNNVKFVVQSDLSEYHGSGHYTVEAEAAEQATGFTESKKFWIRDTGSGHFVALTENFDFTPAEMSVTLNDDGFASLFWDKNYLLDGADAYTGRVEGESVVLTKVNGNGIIPTRSAVILYGSSGAHVTATETLDASTGYDFGNAFRGTLSGISETDVYVLGQTSEPHSTAFYYMAEANIPANRAYIKNVGAGAPLRVRFAEETVTGLESAEADVNVKKVVRDGRVLIIRDGKIYNTMGQIEKAF